MLGTNIGVGIGNKLGFVLDCKLGISAGLRLGCISETPGQDDGYELFCVEGSVLGTIIGLMLITNIGKHLVQNFGLCLGIWRVSNLDLLSELSLDVRMPLSLLDQRLDVY